MKAKIDENIAVLQQGVSLLQGMDDLTYRRCSETVFKSSIGAHVRHNLDHYTSFLAGLEAGEINYEQRQRALVIETDRNAAMVRIGQICSRLEGLTGFQGKVQLWVPGGTSLEGSWADTSVARELEFLLSHTIHHYAIVAIMCRLEGMAIDKDLGVAPSTLRYWAEPKIKCAH
jgi:hypothetical protein